MTKTSPILTIMVRAAEKAARSLRRDFGEVENLQVSRKGPGDFVSAADKRAEEIIFENLQRDKPDFSFLMEEGGIVEGNDKDHCWVIDPLDGTMNFLHGLPHWSISIALQHKEETIAGVVYDPIKDELFTAEKNNGAFMRRKRLRVSGRDRITDAMICTGNAGRTPERLEAYIKEYRAVRAHGPIFRRSGSAALDLAYVAAGRYDGYWERGLKPWDIAAGLLIITEAGGMVYDINDVRKDPVKTGNVLAANGNIVHQMQKVLQSVS